MADLFSMLTRLAERQRSILAMRNLDETSADKKIREALRTGVALLDCWTEEETEAIIEGLVKPVVRKLIAASRWESIDEGASAMLERLRCYTTWHENLIVAASPDTISPAGALIGMMRKWFDFNSRDLARAQRKTERRIVPIKGGSEPEGDDDHLIDLSIEDPQVKLSDLAILSDSWISRLTGGTSIPVYPPRETEAMPDRVVLLFLEWMLWQHLPLDSRVRPASLARFDKWTQQAWGEWRGIPNASAGELSQKLVVSKNQEGRRGKTAAKGLLQEFIACPSPGAEQLTMEEVSALFLYLKEHYFAWKPEFVMTHSFQKK